MFLILMIHREVEWWGGVVTKVLVLDVWGVHLSSIFRFHTDRRVLWGVRDGDCALFFETAPRRDFGLSCFVETCNNTSKKRKRFFSILNFVQDGYRCVVTGSA